MQREDLLRLVDRMSVCGECGDLFGEFVDAGGVPRMQLCGCERRAARPRESPLDLVVARRDYSATSRGDLIEIVLVQVKGGSALWPSLDECARLRRVARHHRARAVVLSVWKKGSMPQLYRLRGRKADSPRAAWKPIEDVAAFFA